MENRRFWETKDSKGSSKGYGFFQNLSKKSKEKQKKTERIYFQDMQTEKEYTSVLLLGSMVQKTDRKGKPFVELSFSDGEENVLAREFNCTADVLTRKGIIKNSLVEVQLQVSDYNGGKRYTVRSIFPANGSKQELLDFIPKAPIYPEYTFDNLLVMIRNSHVDSVKDRNYKSLAYLTENLLRENKTAFCTATAARSIHHNRIGGLLYHTYSMVKNALKQLEIYPSLDKELLICGAALHDIGKILEMSTPLTGNGEYTSAGRLLGHSVLGILMIEDEARKDCYDPERIRLLEHMIASHHGYTECGAIVAPAVPEANILHALDGMDSKMNLYKAAYKDMPDGTISGNIYGMGSNTVYKASVIS